MESKDISSRYSDLTNLLLSKLNEKGYWTGKLADSALSTAVAIVALKRAGNDSDTIRIENGFSWLLENINSDGGYGDTKSSVSNVSTTLLCYAAINYCRNSNAGSEVLKKMEKWLDGENIFIDPESITPSILKFYGRDYTFSIPILAMLHLCGVIPTTALGKIPSLPFELTLLPSSFYRFFNLRVVSYALPALIGVGIYLHKMGGRIRLRDHFIKPALKKLQGLVPESGGFLEAIPLTGFVAMCLHASGEDDNYIVRKGVDFLRNQQRNDGGWPIDTDLSTWVTTLSVKAAGSDINKWLSEEQSDRLRNHLLQLQYKTRHPFNGAEPGGWGWTCFSGSVPDADDTPGAMLALHELYKASKDEKTALENGCRWLMGLQNSDGGFPTFCRGWGRLPFDRSCADLTGHALLAMLKTRNELKFNKGFSARLDRSISKAFGYLGRNQAEDGSWLPLWFGNQLTKNKTNPVYGTAKVTIYLNDCISSGSGIPGELPAMVEKARLYLEKQQNADGSWGGEKGIPGTVEETSLAICALTGYNNDACLKGFDWLALRKELPAAPIGLYFALLWYDEELYPVIYYTEALRRFKFYELLQATPQPSSTGEGAARTLFPWGNGKVADEPGAQVRNLRG